MVRSANDPCPIGTPVEDLPDSVLANVILSTAMRIHMLGTASDDRTDVSRMRLTGRLTDALLEMQQRCPGSFLNGRDAPHHSLSRVFNGVKHTGMDQDIPAVITAVRELEAEKPSVFLVGAGGVSFERQGAGSSALQTPRNTL